MIEQFLWMEKYRPRTINDCVLPKKIKKVFKDYIKKGELPNFLLCGPAGTGKTTAALAMCDEIGADVLFINASVDNGIDVLRTTINQFAATVSLTDAPKVVILDEADRLNATSTQEGLRAFIEQYAHNCRFIFTCNYKSKIIAPLQSRCTTIDFIIPADEKDDIAVKFFTRANEILKLEGVEADPKVLATLIKRYFPDFRKTLNELQSYSTSGKIDVGILSSTSEEEYKKLFVALKTKNYGEARKWVAVNGVDTSSLFRSLYDGASDLLEPSSVPQLVLLLADYQYKAAFAIDQEINTMAALTEIMSECKFK